ncbi:MULTISPECIES: response regulator transcription factor [Dermacoccus]|uniref:response regulator n=1 Tax=Dermacoccus TaxID=57495 RepID=UPI00101CA3AB|nr:MULTISPECIES: response regulator transcription factor [Dermacoccus]MBZ4497703.1 response regulator transcription factor [Dermacoccus sp. Tok2021]RYI21173.1 response regulator transcription factor [Dermacoccus sp. 147Ba]
MTESLRVLIVDDQRMVSGGFSLILSVEDDLDVVATAANGEEALAVARELHPDVTLMDVQMPVMDGIEATRRFVEEGLGRVVILTTFDRDDYLFSALDAGASGFLLKNAEADELAEAVRTVGHGHALLAPEVTRRVIERRTAQQAAPEADARLAALTPRERDVLALLGRGRSNAEIADELFVGEATVKTHVSNVLMKLDLRDRVQAAVAAYETGLVRVGEQPGT